MDFCRLLLHIIIPVLLPASLLMLCSKGSILSRLSKLYSLKPAESLITQKLFWLSIIIPVALFVSFGTICWDGYRILLSKDGIDEFLKISSLPLTLLSAAIPLGVVVASFHSTQQTGEQIRNTQHKNNLDSYYSHRNEFFTHFSRHIETSYHESLTGKFKPHPLLYYNCTIGTPEQGTPKINVKQFKHIEQNFETAAQNLHCIVSYTYDDFMPSQYFYYACAAIQKLAKDMGLTEISSGMTEISHSFKTPSEYLKIAGPQIMTVGTTTDEIIAALRYTRDFYITLCVFFGYGYDPIFKPFEYLFSGTEILNKPGYTNIEKIYTLAFELSSPPEMPTNKNVNQY